MRAGLDAAVAAASAALGEFASFLAGEVVARAPVRDALGADRYRLGVLDFLGTDLDLEETYRWGWEELARIESEMAAAAERIAPGEPLPAVLAALDADPAYRVEGAEAFVAWIQELADRAIADLDGAHFDIPGPLRRIECQVPPVESGVYFRDPAHRLGMLAGGQRFRAARVVLDIGMHLELEIPRGAGFGEGERWSPELGLEFLRSRMGAQAGASAAFEIDRYLGRPGQAIAYKLGERIWLEAREAARRREGAGFDLKVFHRRALDLGPMGLDLLRAELARP